MSENLTQHRHEKSGQPKKEQLIFLAEDDHDDIFLFEKALSTIGTGYRLSVYENGQELLDAVTGIAPRLPDLIFLDINMPVQTGLECLMNLRKMYPSSVPVFLLSTAQDRLNIEQARKMGATGYLAKPAFTEDLGNLLTNVLSIDWSARSENDFYVHLQFAGT